MNKVIDTKLRMFMNIVGPSGCGKTRLVFEMLQNDIFKPKFDKIFFFYQNEQQVFKEQQNLNIEFIEGINFELIKNLPNDGTNYLLIFDDSMEELLRSKEFLQCATAGRHKKQNVIFIKHNLYHQGPYARSIELQVTHIVLFNNPRAAEQIATLAKQLKLPDLESWLNDATEKPYGYLMLDFDPFVHNCLRRSSGLNYTKFYLTKSQSRITHINDEHTKRLYGSADNVITS